MPDDRWCRFCLEWSDSEECAFCGSQTVPYSDLIDQAYERQVEKELLKSARKHVITPEEHAAQVVAEGPAPSGERGGKRRQLSGVREA